MRRKPAGAVVGSCLVLVAAGAAAVPLVTRVHNEASAGNGRAESTFADLPLPFIENRGQAPREIEFYLHGADTSIGFSPQGLLVSLADRQGTSQRWNLGLEFVDARPTLPAGSGETPTVVSYFKGAPGEWHTGLATYARVVYRDLWPGIDLVYSGTGSQLKYSLLVEPGADPSDIRLSWRGATGLEVNRRGQLEVATPAGSIVEEAPYSYQEIDGRRIEVPSAFTAAGDSYGFALGTYDRSLPLVIDPAMLLYAGFIGGSDGESGRGIAVDGAGAAYVTGQTTSTQTTFPDGDGFGTLTGPDTTHNGGTDAFVAKVNPSGTGLVYLGYIGGSAADNGQGIDVDGTGAAYVVGTTASTQGTFPDGDGFGTVTGPDTSHNGGTSDAFVAKVAPSGISLLYAGYVGGSGFDNASRVAVDGTGAAYLSGYTSSTGATFPDGDGFGTVTGPDTTHNGGVDAFVAKVAPTGASLVYAGYIGGGLDDFGWALDVDGAAAAYVTGQTTSTQTTFPDGDGFGTVTGPDTTHNGGVDAFVAKVSPSGTSLSYAGYIGGFGGDTGFGIALDGAARAHVTGESSSTQATFPDGDGFGSLTGPDTTYNGGGDAFVAAVAPSGASLASAGYIGGSGGDSGSDVAVDGTGAVYVNGDTDSTESTFPDGDGFGSLTGPDTTYNGGFYDAIVAKVAPSGTSLVYAGYIGGSGDDYGFGIALDTTGAAYVTGETDSTQTTFPDGDGFGSLTGPDTTSNGTFEAYLAKVVEPAPAAKCKGKVATLTGTPDGDVLTGTGGADVIAALGGKDRVKALGGNDLVCAGDGNDTANGGGGKDKVFGEKGKDRLKGAGGNDRLNGGGGRDRCNGGPGTSDRASKCEKQSKVP